MTFEELYTELHKVHEALALDPQNSQLIQGEQDLEMEIYILTQG